MSHTVDGVTRNYIWDVASGLPVVLQDGTNTYVYGLDLVSATDNAGARTFYLQDGLGSTTDLVDGSGNSVASYGYDVFGAIRTQDGASPNYWLFTGEQQDSESDLYYLRARHYDPTTGRFLTQDPLWGSAGVPQTQNRYPYVGCNPVNRIDPTGLMWITQASGGLSKEGSSFNDTLAPCEGRLVPAPETLPRQDEHRSGAGMVCMKEGPISLSDLRDFLQDINWRNVAAGGTLVLAGGALIGVSILGTQAVVSTEIAAAPETGLLSAILIPHSIGVFGVWLGGIGVATSACGVEIIRTGECFGSGTDDRPQGSPPDWQSTHEENDLGSEQRQRTQTEY